MRKKLIKWIENCVTHLQDECEGNEEALLLINAFITQYDIRAMNMLGKSSLAIQKSKVKTKIARFLFPKEANKEIILRTENQTPVDIIFWPFQKMHIDVSNGIYSELIKREHCKPKIFSHNPPVIKLIEQKKVEEQISINMGSGFPFYDYKKNKVHKTILSQVEKLPVFRYKDKTITFKAIIKDAWLIWYSLYAYTVDVYKELVKQYQPKAFFVGNDLTLVGNTVCRLAKRDGIKTFSIMHGSIKNELWKYNTSDTFFVFGSKDKALMLQRGIAPEKLIVSGSPKVEERLKNRDFTSFSYKYEDYILIALSGPGHSVSEEHHVEVLEVLYQLAQKYSQYHFVFKLHKKDKTHFYTRLANLANVAIIAYDNTVYSANIYDWIQHSKLLVTGASTSALDAILFSKPVITIDLLNHFSDVDFIKDGITLHAVDYQGLNKHFDTIIEGKATLAKHIEKSKTFINGAFTQKAEGSILFVTKVIEDSIRSCT